MDGKVVGKLRNGSVASVVGVDPSTGWFRLNVNKEEWVSPAYIKSTQMVRIKASALNVRDSDSEKGKILATLPNNSSCYIYAQSTNTGWYLTNQGWISNSSNHVERL